MKVVMFVFGKQKLYVRTNRQYEPFDRDELSMAVGYLPSQKQKAACYLTISIVIAFSKQLVDVLFVFASLIKIAVFVPAGLCDPKADHRW